MFFSAAIAEIESFVTLVTNMSATVNRWTQTIFRSQCCHPPYVNIEKRINSELYIRSSIKMKSFFIFLLIVAVNTAETSTLQRKVRTTTSTTTTKTTTTTTKATISSIQINVFASQKFSQGCPSLKSSLCSRERSLEQLRSIIKISNSALS